MIVRKLEALFTINTNAVQFKKAASELDRLANKAQTVMNAIAGYWAVLALGCHRPKDRAVGPLKTDQYLARLQMLYGWGNPYQRAAERQVILPLEPPDFSPGEVQIQALPRFAYRSSAALVY